MLLPLSLGLYEYDPRCACLYGDATCAALLGLEAGRLAAGLPLVELLPALASDTPAPPDLLPAADTGWLAWMPAGTGRRWLNFQRQGDQGVVLDVTTLYEQTQRLQVAEAFNRSVMTCSVDCIKELSLAGELLSMNPGGLEVMEIDDFTCFAGACWVQFWPELHRRDVETALAEARAGRVGRFTGMAPTAKGNARWWDVVVTPIFDAGQQPARLLAISRDVTTQVHALRELDDLNHTLEARIEARS